MHKLSKAPGDRGGHVIGTTRSGRPIYASGQHTGGFSKQDHQDASAAHHAQAEKFRATMGAEHDKSRAQGKGVDHVSPAADKAYKNMLHHFGQRDSHDSSHTKMEMNEAAEAHAQKTGANERMATGAEMAKLGAGRPEKRAMTPAEHGRMAVTPKIQSHPWEGKSMKRKSGMRKSDAQPFNEAGDRIGFTEADEPFGYARLDDSGKLIASDASGMDELASMISDFAGASVRQKVMQTLTGQEPGLGSLPPQDPSIEVSGNVPAESPETTVDIAPGGGAGPMTKALGTEPETYLTPSHEAKAADASYQPIGLWQCLDAPDIEGDDRFAYVGRC